MIKKWNKRVMAAVMTAVMLMGTSTTVFANASPPEGQEAAQEQNVLPVEGSETESASTEASQETPQTEPAPAEDGSGGTAFSTPGTAQVQDDITEDGSKEFLTITTKINNTFYLVIDRSASSENVYMLSQIDENDLQEFLKEGTVTEKTTAPSVVLEENNTDSTEADKETEPAQEENQEEDPDGNMAGILAILILAGAGVGAYYYFRIHKKKAEAEEERSEGIELGDGLETVDEREEDEDYE